MRRRRLAARGGSLRVALTALLLAASVVPGWAPLASACSVALPPPLPVLGLRNGSQVLFDGLAEQGSASTSNNGTSEPYAWRSIAVNASLKAATGTESAENAFQGSAIQGWITGVGYQPRGLASPWLIESSPVFGSDCKNDGFWDWETQPFSQTAQAGPPGASEAWVSVGPANFSYVAATPNFAVGASGNATLVFARWGESAGAARASDVFHISLPPNPPSSNGFGGAWPRNATPTIEALAGSTTRDEVVVALGPPARAAQALYFLNRTNGSRAVGVATIGAEAVAIELWEANAGLRSVQVDPDCCEVFLAAGLFANAVSLSDRYVAVLADPTLYHVPNGTREESELVVVDRTDWAEQNVTLPGYGMAVRASNRGLVALTDEGVFEFDDPSNLTNAVAEPQDPSRAPDDAILTPNGRIVLLAAGNATFDRAPDGTFLVEHSPASWGRGPAFVADLQAYGRGLGTGCCPATANYTLGCACHYEPPSEARKTFLGLPVPAPSPAVVVALIAIAATFSGRRRQFR